MAYAALLLTGQLSPSSLTIVSRKRAAYVGIQMATGTRGQVWTSSRKSLLRDADGLRLNANQRPTEPEDEGQGNHLRKCR